MKATIVHDEHGKIISIAKVGDLKAAGSKITKVEIVGTKPNHRVLEIELSSSLESIPTLQLHDEYQVDVAASKLIKKKT
jgi:hypothetical protein